MASYHHPVSSAMQHSSGTSLNPAYSSLQARSLYGSSSSLPYLNSSLSYKSPYTTYGGTASGYGGVTLPASASSALYSNSFHQYSPGLSSYPGSSSSLHNERLYPQTTRSRSLHSNHYISPHTSTFGSRCNSSLSLQSDTSEGYSSSGDKSGRSSRLSSTGTTDAVENGEIDYKKLYEESILENERLREKLRRTEEDLKEARGMPDKSVTSGKGSMSETEKRERRAMERKLSEMEEELKQLQKLKLENERLRAENRALTRVVSKLTASANAGK